MVCENDSLNYLIFEEGLIYKTTSRYAYEYHWGNVRVTFQTNGSATTVKHVTEYIWLFGYNRTDSAGSFRCSFFDEIALTCSLSKKKFTSKGFHPVRYLKFPHSCQSRISSCMPAKMACRTEREVASHNLELVAKGTHNPKVWWIF